MRICVDLDGVVCQLRGADETYDQLLPVAGAVAKLRALRAAGHTIILFTARHMKTCDGNAGRAMARIGPVTLEWLARHGVEYDEIYFGKPWADVYIDDNALRFESWSLVADDASNLPQSAETRLAHRVRPVK